ncbi:DMT family protein [Vibrio fluvialis]|uniref:DMT family protein n=1 Tax=Vibrio fluvialis TaxID=676 RepID=UPI00192B58D8|nr:DMT family protein [Vibrio fluvialis]MBL4237175.1 DMT family protein [Vibrio fluvialis]MBL4264369.1 DMT family protein [Vibrio fluvialis]MBL4268596.1 DMT family protein [Vibrio fluvialis]MBL4272026.1 DMT family protein [Vibrio fluvialis]MBL4303476.1 DMT family protein [Vibrio fluvialis]
MFALPPMLITIVLLLISNVFMTFAWYAHLRELGHKPWVIAALLSWGIALFEYLFQVPANRIGYTVMNLGQLKILQEVITLSVFVPFALIYMKEPFRMDFVWAGLCLLGAVFFIFRPQILEILSRAVA